MKSKAGVLLFTCLIVLGLGCKPKQVVEPPVAMQPSPPATASCGEALSRGTALYKDGFVTFSGVLEGDCLHLKYSYSGGCKEHAVDLYWSGSWAESIPPVTHLYVSHNANGDGCEAIKSGKSSFDLKPLRYEGLGQVVVDVHAEGMPLVRINYTYSNK